ncbi:MAG: extracellular solute-binding protein, partial [bacterium]|nr:extracellular solute-binding protein [bacterium]
MKSRLKLVVLLAAFAMVAAACGDSADDTTTAAPATTQATTTTAAPTTTTTTAAPTTTTEAPKALELVIWADENRTKVILEVAPAFTEATGVEVTVQTVDFGEIRGQVQSAGPAGEGPDIFIGAGDWSGELAANGVAAPLDLGSAAGEFSQISLDMFSFDGSLYALPYATEAVAMYYNMDLVAEAPTTWADLTAACDGLGDAITNCFGAPGGGDGGDAYHMYPFLTSQGGNIFGYDSATGWDGTSVLLDSAESVAGVQVLADQVAAGYIGSTNYDGAKNQFLEGTQPFWMT